MRQTIGAVQRILQDESGQDIAENAGMVAVILLILIGTEKLIGINAIITFSNVTSRIDPGG